MYLMSNACKYKILKVSKSFATRSSGVEGWPGTILIYSYLLVYVQNLAKINFEQFLYMSLYFAYCREAPGFLVDDPNYVGPP